MAQVDAALEVDVVGGHIVLADGVIDAVSRATDGGDDVVARSQPRDVRSDPLHPAETLVTDDQEVVALRGLTILGGVDLLVGSVDSHTKNCDQHSAPVGNVGLRRFGQLREMNASGLARDHCDRFHLKSSFPSSDPRRVARSP